MSDSNKEVSFTSLENKKSNNGQSTDNEHTQTDESYKGKGKEDSTNTTLKQTQEVLPPNSEKGIKDNQDDHNNYNVSKKRQYRMWLLQYKLS